MKYLIVVVTMLVMFGCAGAKYTPPLVSENSKVISKTGERCYTLKFPYAAKIISAKEEFVHVEEQSSFEKINIKSDKYFVNFTHGYTYGNSRVQFRMGFPDLNNSEAVLYDSDKYSWSDFKRYKIDIYKTDNGKRILRTTFIMSDAGNKNIGQLWVYRGIGSDISKEDLVKLKGYTDYENFVRYVADSLTLECR